MKKKKKQLCSKIARPLKYGQPQGEKYAHNHNVMHSQ